MKLLDLRAALLIAALLAVTAVACGPEPTATPAVTIMPPPTATPAGTAAPDQETPVPPTEAPGYPVARRL